MRVATANTKPGTRDPGLGTRTYPAALHLLACYTGGMEPAKPRSPFFATKVCFFVGLAALALWMLTFRPHGNSNLDWLLFPAAARISDFLYPQSDVPVWFWYGACLLQYPALGLIIDAVRYFRRTQGPDNPSEKAQ